ncbi:MAG: LPS export ABC transporter permease LptF [Gammaproteobacteria bacterium]|nr:LPS export ABC transporter permease LptF [Gammaproteobacteria bacterium]
MNRIINRYLLKEVLQSWFMVTLVLWLIVVSNRLAGYFAEAAAGQIPIDAVFLLIALKSVTYLSALLPLSLFLGILLALGRLYKDSEIIALSACGVGMREIYRPILYMSLLAALLVAWMTLYLAPKTAIIEKGQRIQAEKSMNIKGITAGRFHELNGGRMVFFVGAMSADGQHMKNLFVENSSQGRIELITADQARMWHEEGNDADYLLMEQGYRFQGDLGQDGYRVMSFSSYAIKIELPGGARGTKNKTDTIASMDLWHSDRLADGAELQWRLSMPVAIIVLAFLAVPLARVRPRDGRYGRLFVAIMVFIVYYNLLGSARIWLEKGMVSSWLGLWWVHLFPLLLGYGLWKEFNAYGLFRKLYRRGQR